MNSMQRARDTFLLATTNRGKVEEFAEPLKRLQINIVDLSSIAHVPEIEETGSSFAENAAIKAKGYAAFAGMCAIADDSGLEVNALGGRPGVLSARFGGNYSYDVKMQYLLDEMAAAGSLDRSAQFRCAIAVADPEANLLFTCEATCDGMIAQKPLGDNGFGYDPIFIPKGFSETFGELPAAMKSQLSHRSRAISLLIPFLRDFSTILT